MWLFSSGFERDGSAAASRSCKLSFLWFLIQKTVAIIVGSDRLDVI